MSTIDTSDKTSEQAEDQANEQNEQARSSFENAEISAQSSLLSPEQRQRIALEFATEGFVTDPSNSEGLTQLIELAKQKGLSIFDLDIREALLIAVEVEVTRNLIAAEVSFVFDESSPSLSTKIQNTIFVLERLVEVDEPDPAAIFGLSRIYERIGRNHEALDLLRRIAERRDVFAWHYLDLAYRMERYDDMLDFWENSDFDDVPDGILYLVADTYQKKATHTDHSMNSQERLNQKYYDGTSEEDYENILRAKRLFSKAYQPLAVQDGSTPQSLIKVLNYAHVLYQEADLIRHCKNVDDLPVSGYEDLIRESMEISGGVIKLLEDNGVNAEDHPEYYRILLFARFYFVDASAFLQSSDEELEGYIAMARDLDDDEQFEKLGGEVVVLHHLNLMNLLVKKFNEEEDESLLEEIENIILDAIKIDWREETIYIDGIEFFVDYKPETAFMLENYLHLVSILKQLIDIDKLGIKGGELCFAAFLSRRSSAEYWEGLREMIDATEQHAIPFEEYLRPLYDALEPYRAKYEEFLEEISPEGTKISSRLKSSPSILLKFLKGATHKGTLMPLFRAAKTDEEALQIFETVSSDLGAAFIKDVIGFRALTDSEGGAREVFERIKADLDNMFDKKDRLDKPPGEYRSLDVCGFSRSCGFDVDTQTRTKEIEAEMEMSDLHHAHYKTESGEKLERAVDKDPLYYINLLANIMAGLVKAYKELQSIKNPDLETVIACYKKHGLPFKK